MAKHVHIGDATLLATLRSARDGHQSICIDPSPMGKILLARIEKHLASNPIETLQVSKILNDINKRGQFYKTFASIFEGISVTRSLGSAYWRNPQVDEVYRQAISNMTAKQLKERIKIIEKSAESAYGIGNNSADLVTLFYPSVNDENAFQSMITLAKNLLKHSGIFRISMNLESVHEQITTILDEENFEYLKCTPSGEKPLSLYELFWSSPLTKKLNDPPFYLEARLR